MSLSIQAMPRGRAENIYTLPAAVFDAAATDFPLIIRTTVDGDLARLAKADGSNLRFSLPDGTTPPQINGYAGVLETDVAWTQNGPYVAERYVAPGVDRTFVGCYRFQEAAFDIGQYDHLTGKWTVTRLANISESDDHDGVTIAIHPDGTVFAFCPQHSTADLRVFRSDVSADISSFTELDLSDVGGVALASYAHPIFVGTTLFLEWQDGVASTRDRVFTTSTDKGATWTAKQTLITEASERPYCHIFKDDTDDIHIAFTPGSPTEIATGQNHVYHAKLRLSNSSFYKTDGTLIGTVAAGPLTKSNATLAMSAATFGNNLFTMGVAADASGNISIAIREAVGLDIWYDHARWNGTTWSAERVVEGGETIVGPSEATPGWHYGWWQTEDADVVLAGVQVADKTSEIREYTRQSAGNWTYTVLSSANSGNKMRAVEVRNAHPDMRVLFLNGEFHQFNDSDTRLDLCAYPGPVAMGRLTSLVQVSVDGTNDLDLKLHVGDAGSSIPGPFTNATVLSVGEIGRRTLLDDSSTVHDLLAECTVVGAINSKSFVGNQYLISDLGGSSQNEYHFMLRIRKSTGNVHFGIALAEGNKGIEGSDIAATAGQLIGICGSYNGSSVRVARDGTVSATTNPATTATKDQSAGPLWSGTSPHEVGSSSDQLTGSVDFAMILPEGKDNDWMRMATLGCGPASYTAGAWEYLPALVFSGANAMPLSVGEVVQS